MPTKPAISLVLPCRNEAEALPAVLAEAAAATRALDVPAEIIVVDNGSSDGSREILALAANEYPELVVVAEPRPGYGAAHRRGLAAARGEAVVLADCDGTYPLDQALALATPIARGDADLVIGNRFIGGIPNGAMPWMHRHVGNPLLSGLVRALSGSEVRDVHCGARAISREALARMNLQTSGMEFASEMVLEATRLKLRVDEAPVSYRPRLGQSKLRTFRDGFRHLYLVISSFARQRHGAK